MASSADRTRCRLCGDEFENNHAEAVHRVHAHSKDAIKADMIDALRELGDELGEAPRACDMEELGPYSSNTYQNRFGSWNEAVEIAGFERTRVFDREEVECLNCGDTFTKNYAEAQRHDYHFCDSECMGEWQISNYAGEGNPRYTKTEVECSYCGETLLRADWELERNHHHYCGFECRGRHWSETGARTGKDSPVWKGGKLYYGHNWEEQRQKALKRDGFECRTCGLSQGESYEQYNTDLHVHHRTPIREFEDRVDGNKLSNLVTVCCRCHMKWEHLPVQPQLTN